MSLVRCLAALFLFSMISTSHAAEPSPETKDEAAGSRKAKPRRTIQFTEDSLETVKKNVTDGTAVLVDVRSEAEWKEGRLEGSIFVPVTSLQRDALDPSKLEETLPKKGTKILYTFCVVGMRAKQAGIVLEKQGYTVRALKPGYQELLKAGFKEAESKE